MNVNFQIPKKLDWLIPASARVSRYAAVLLVLFFFLVASAWIVNANKLAITSHFDSYDEYFVLPAVAGKHLSPFGEPYRNQVGEMTRWFARALYPLGIYYVNSHMGGAVIISGWKYPGGYYLRKHLEDRGPEEWKELLRFDPNIQDFFFFMRTAFSLMAICSFCLVLWALFERFNPAAMAAYGGLILSSRLVLDQFDFFYSETAMFILFNLAVFLCLRFKESTYHNHKAGWLGILSAAALSTKSSGVLIAVPLFMYVIFNMRGPGHRTMRRVEVFLFFIFSSLVVFNLNYGSLFDYINKTLADIWQYKTGYAIAVNVDIAWIMNELGYFIFTLFLLSMVWFAGSFQKRLIPIYALGAIAVFIIWSTWDASHYFPRNLASAYLAMSFIVALCTGDLIRRIPARWKFIKMNLSAVSVLAFLLVGILLAYGMPSLHDEFFRGIRQSVKSCSNIAAVGLSKKELSSLDDMKGEIVFFPGIQKPYTLPDVPRQHVIGTLSPQIKEPIGRLLEENPDLGGIFEKLNGYACLIVYREGHTKQVTNFTAPKTHTLERRIGNLFFFKKNTG